MAQPDYPRVAFFTDCFHEVNGVALTSRQLTAFARRNHRPFLAVYSGGHTTQPEDEHPLALPLRRGRATIPVERDFGFDPLLWRYRTKAREMLKAFRPDVIHVTSPGDFGLLGAWLARQMRVPLIASWHTNIDEFTGRRLAKLLGIAPKRLRDSISRSAEGAVLQLVERFYKIANIIMAPNPEIAARLRQHTRKPTRLMMRGVDIQRFAPSRRTRHDGIFRLGFVGRISPEKNVRFLAEIEKALLSEGKERFRFVVVGDGSEMGWLKRNLINAEFTGVLLGEALAEAYANMDAFVFPSQTDTFGNVILEAQASAVPVIVMSQGGPKFLVQHGTTGLIARDEADFIRNVLRLMSHPGERDSMSRCARKQAETRSWDRVFEDVYRIYAEAKLESEHLSPSFALATTE